MSRGHHRDLHILCVDRDPDIRLIVELSLHLDPHIRAISVSSTSEALTYLNEQQFDLVLLDAIMPNEGGIAFLERITKPDGSPPTPVIFLTADLVRREQYALAGILGVIPKPFDPMTLADVTRSMLANAVSELAPRA